MILNLLGPIRSSTLKENHIGQRDPSVHRDRHPLTFTKILIYPSIITYLIEFPMIPITAMTVRRTPSSQYVREASHGFGSNSIYKKNNNSV